MMPSDTIAAIATPPGKGGIGILRVSGPGAGHIMQAMLGKKLKPRFAARLPFLDANDSIIDNGIALYFPAPKSFTGEDILELHAHGGPLVMDMLLRRALALGVRLARPGEFSERAFLNGKIDLAQAEAIADLIESTSEQAVRSAQRSLQGEFSRYIHELVDKLVELRLYVEAAIDFAEEDIDFLGEGAVAERLQAILVKLQCIKRSANQGCLMRDGMTVVIAGEPNAGKSSLLNCLSGRETAIVTDRAGTTRDALHERIQIDGLPLHIIDTAGLRESEDSVEQQGIRRAREEIHKADHILLIMDDSVHAANRALIGALPDNIGLTRIHNKIDLTGAPPGSRTTADGIEIYLSCKTGAGLAALHQHLKACMGYAGESEDVFIARRRHLDALARAESFVQGSIDQLNIRVAPELLAEDLRQAQHALAEITGEFTSEDLLGRIFSSFCIGK